MKGLSIALCSINSKYIHSSLAVWYLYSVIYKHRRVSAGVVESTINNPLDETARRITEKSPDIIGISCYIWNIRYVKQLIKIIKSHLPGVIIVLGGPEVSYNAGEVLRENPMVDYIISGEGEKPFALLVDAVLNGKSPAGIPGLCRKTGDGFFISGPYTPEDIPESPYIDEYYETLDTRIAYIETSRGCPYSCAFCLSGRCGGVRYFDIDRAEREIIRLSNSGAKTIKLVDRTFNANPERAKKIFEFVINNYGERIPCGTCFHFEIAGDIIDNETLDMLAASPAGAIQFEIGVQSFNPETLEAARRKTNIEKLVQNIKRLIQNGNIHIHIDLIAGLPHEDLKSFENSFNTAYELKPHMLQLGFLKILHGSRMREQPEEYPCSYLPEPPYQVTETPWLSRRDLELLRHVERELNRMYNSGRFRRTLGYVLKECGLSPFELFTRLGIQAELKGIKRIPLDGYIEFVYSYSSEIRGIDKDKLRDMLACDFVSTNPFGRFPDSLKTYDARLKNAMKKLEDDPKTRRPKGVKRGAVLLYSENSIAYSDYLNRDPVTREYPLHKVEL